MKRNHPQWWQYIWDIRWNRVHLTQIRTDLLEHQSIHDSVPTANDSETLCLTDRSNEPESTTRSTRRQNRIRIRCAIEKSNTTFFDRAHSYAEGTKSATFPLTEKTKLPQSSTSTSKRTTLKDDDLEHVPLGLWKVDHPELIKKISEQQILITKLEEDIARIRDKTTIWQKGPGNGSRWLANLMRSWKTQKRSRLQVSLTIPMKHNSGKNLLILN